MALRNLLSCLLNVAYVISIRSWSLPSPRVWSRLNFLTSPGSFLDSSLAIGVGLAWNSKLLPYSDCEVMPEIDWIVLEVTNYFETFFLVLASLTLIVAIFLVGLVFNLPKLVSYFCSLKKSSVDGLSSLPEIFSFLRTSDFNELSFSRLRDAIIDDYWIKHSSSAHIASGVLWEFCLIISLKLCFSGDFS